MRRIAGAGVVAVAVLAALPLTAAAQSRAPKAPGKPFLDARAGARARASRAGARSPYVAAGARTIAARAALRASLGRRATLAVDPLTGTPSQLVRLDRALSGPASGDRATIALDYVRDNRAALGLDAADLDNLALVGRSRGAKGLQVLRWQQRVRGIPAFDNDLRVAVDRAGRVISVTGSPRHDLSVASTTPALDAGAALRRLQENVGAVRTVAVQSGPAGARRTTRFAGGGFARLVLFGAAGSTRLAWHLGYRAAATQYYDAVVDATSGAILYRQNLVRFEKPALIYPNFPAANDPPDTNAPRLVDLEALGYLPADATTLSGPFAHSYVDADGNLQPDAGEEVVPKTDGEAPYVLRTTDGTHNFEDPGHGCTPVFLCTWTSNFPASWQTNREQAAVQLHWAVGNFHDHLAADPIDFTDASGNFEVGGTGGDDPVQANSDEGAATGADGGPDPSFTNNAFMIPLPDGTPPEMAMYLNEFFEDIPFRDNDNGDDAATVYHEYTHGLSNRLVTNADGTGALASPQAGAMGEAWSDWYAFDLLARDRLDVDDLATPGEMDLGKYSDAVPHVTRFQGLDCPVGALTPACPGGVDTVAGGFTYGDFGRVFIGPEVHSDGEIWGETLWDLRQQLVTRFGDEDGSDVAEALVTDGMRLSPPEPSMLDERNAIIAADLADFGGADVNLLWNVFRRRGMGYYAGATNGDDITPVEDFSRPPAADAPKGAIAGTVSDALTGLPLAGARVGLGGHATAPGFPDFLADDTAADGGYRIDGVPAATYPKLSFQADGYDLVTARNVTVPEDATTRRDAALRRDWAASKGGATVAQSEASPEADCDARFLIDQTGAGWETFNDGDDTTGPSATITLPQTVDVSAFLMNPSNTCGDGASASTKDYRLETSSDGVSFRLAKAGSFTPDDRNRLNTVVPDGDSGRAVRYVRLTLLSPQLTCATCSGNDFVDFTELEAIGGPPNRLPEGALTVSPSSVAPGAPVTFTASFTDADSAITGYDWDFDGDGRVDQSTSAPTVSFAYPAAGTYTATVAAKDFRGGAGTAHATVTVRSGPTPTPARPRLTLPASGSSGRYSFTLTCAVACRVTAKATLSRALARKLHLRHRTVGELTRRITSSRRQTLRITLSKALRSAARKAKVTRIKAVVSVTATNTGGGSTKKSRTVTIRL